MGKGSSKTTVANNIDPRTQAALDEYRRRASASAANPASGGIITPDFAAKNLGFGSETGLGNIGDYYDPYEKDVVGALQGDFGRQRTLAGNAAADQATRDNAFGGSRAAVLSGELQSGVNRAEGATLANVRSAGFNDAATRLMADRQRSANLGFGGAQYLDSRERGYNQDILNSVPYGNTTQTTSAPHDPFALLKTLAAAGIDIYAMLDKNKKQGTSVGPGTYVGKPGFAPGELGGV